MHTNRTIAQPSLRVGMVTPTLAPGGAERWVITLMQHAQRVRWKKLFLRSEDASVDLLPLVPRDVEIVADWPVSVSSVDDLDVVVGWGGDPFHIIGHDPDMDRPTILVSHSMMHKFSTATANYFAAVSEGAKSIFPDSIDHDDIALIYNGVDAERCLPRMGRETQRQLWGLFSNDKVALYLGRFSPEKDPYRFMEVIAASDGWIGVMLGWGELRKSCMEYAAQKAANKFLFPQATINHVGDALAACDAVVIPSKSECCPLVMLEAWQANRPVYMNHELPIFSEMRSMGVGGLYTLPDQLPIPTERITDPVTDEQREQFSASAMVHRWEEYIYGCFTEWHKAHFLGQLQSSVPDHPIPSRTFREVQHETETNDPPVGEGSGPPMARTDSPEDSE